MKIPFILRTISKDIQCYHNKTQTKAIVVGGAVRDYFLELPSKDYDIEVYGLDTIEALEKILCVYGSVNLVGKSFGVLKFSYEGEEYDFSFPRRESKTDKGHRGFDVFVDGTLPYHQASKRRDFTINALGYDIAKEAFIDPFDGRKDMQTHTLRHIDDTTFVEDPLRIYRAVQFCARFGYTLAKDTFALCQQMVKEGMLDELPKERIYTEWTKLLLKSPKPSIGFELMRELGILKGYFPELYALIDVPQSPQWHPEGDVWIHTMMTLDEMAQLCRDSPVYDQRQKLKFLFAILCHDLGKATHTTIEKEGRIRAIGHESAGVAPTKSLLYRLSDEHDFIQSILPLVEHHLKPSQFYAGKAKASAFRRLATRVNIEELVVVAKADFLGRTTTASLARVYHAGEWMLKQSKTLNVHKAPLKCLLQGRDLIALGLKPSLQFKEILAYIYEQQLVGAIGSKQSALDVVKEKYCA